MTASIPDAPLGTADEDLLNRGPFALGLARLIADAPSGSTLRIGVFGGWGEGKTSVLHIMREELKKRGHLGVWLVPWVTDNSQEIAQWLTTAIATQLGIDLAEFESAKNIAKLMKNAGDIAEVDPRLKALHALLEKGLSGRLEGKIQRQGEALALRIEELLGDRKLIVFVDDVDRVRADLVPNLLLTLREGLDRPNFYYVLALDPEVVERGLSQVHEGWGTSRAFLEKIIELPRYLPTPSPETIATYIDSVANAAGSSEDRETLRALSTALPINPRKIKLILRYFATLNRMLKRFGAFELSRRTFYLVQLLRFEFPLESGELVRDSKAVNSLQYGGFLGTVGGTGAPKPHPEEQYAPTDIRQRRRFMELCEYLRQASPESWVYYDLASQANLPENEPSFSYQEVSNLVDGWEASTPAKRPKLIRGALRRKGGRLDSQKIREFWAILMKLREVHLSGVIETQVEEAVKKGMKTASEMTTIADLVGIEFGCFANGDLGPNEWVSLLQVSARWARFALFDYYEEERVAERDLVKRSFEELPSRSKADLFTFLSLRDPERNLGAAFEALLEEFKGAAALEAANRVLGLLNQEAGLEILWGEKPGSASLKAVVFSRSSPLYENADVNRSFLDIAATAGQDPLVHANFLTLFRQLAYGATTGGSYSRDECQKIVQLAPVINAIWNAAVARPLNPRVAGSLREQRAAIAPGITPEANLPLPTWWKKLEEMGFFKPD